MDSPGSVEQILCGEDGEGGAVHRRVLTLGGDQASAPADAQVTAHGRHLVHVVRYSIIAPLPVLKAHAPRGHVIRPGHYCGRHCDVTSGVCCIVLLSNPNPPGG